MTWEALEARINKKAKKVLFDGASGFKADIMGSPVVSGDLKNAYRIREIKGGYKVTNHLCYAARIFIGAPYNTDVDCGKADKKSGVKRKSIGAKVPEGFYPLLKTWDKIIANNMKKVLS